MQLQQVSRTDMHIHEKMYSGACAFVCVDQCAQTYLHDVCTYITCAQYISRHALYESYSCIFVYVYMRIHIKLQGYTCNTVTHLNTYTYTHTNTQKKHISFRHIYTPIRVFRYTQDFWRYCFLFFLFCSTCVYTPISECCHTDEFGREGVLLSCRVFCIHSNQRVPTHT